MSHLAPIDPIPLSIASTAHQERSVWRTSIFSTDHKTIAKQYLFLGLFMALIGGYLVYVMRWQLAFPDTSIPGF